MNLYEVFDDEHKKLLKKYNIDIENKILTDEEYTAFLRKTDIMSMEDMEDIYDYLYFYNDSNKEI